MESVNFINVEQYTSIDVSKLIDMDTKTHGHKAKKKCFAFTGPKTEIRDRQCLFFFFYFPVNLLGFYYNCIIVLQFFLFLCNQGWVQIHFLALRPCSNLTLGAESGLWLRNTLNFSSVFISQNALSHTCSHALCIGSQSEWFCCRKCLKWVIPNVALPERWSVILKSHYSPVLMCLIFTQTIH